MATLVNHAILSELQSLYPYLQLKPLTPQQETLLRLLLEGATLSSASRGAGYSSNQKAKIFLDTDPAKIILKYFSEQEIERINFTKDRATEMFYELYTERANSNEGARVVEGLVRLHGLSEEARNRIGDTNITINQQNNNNNYAGMDEATIRKKLEVMDEKTLIQQAGPRFDGLELEPEPIDVTPLPPQQEEKNDG